MSVELEDIAVELKEIRKLLQLLVDASKTPYETPKDVKSFEEVMDKKIAEHRRKGERYA